MSHAATARKQSNRLPDGRAIRSLAKGEQRTFRQAEMFGLAKARLFDPAIETIMTVREHDVSIQSGAYKSVNENGWWRTAKYGVYARGFERELDKRVGNSVVWTEVGVSYTFEVPDVRHPTEDKPLSHATGMLVLPLAKLEFDEGTRAVKVAPNLYPETDVQVVDIMRPRAWALVDADGVPLRTEPSGANTQEARYSYIRHSDEFEEGATGWHGSLSRVVLGVLGFDYGGRYVLAGSRWSGASGVAVVGHEVAASLKAGAPKITKEGDRVIIEGTPEQLEAAMRLLEPLGK